MAVTASGVAAGTGAVTGSGGAFLTTPRGRIDGPRGVLLPGGTGRRLWCFLPIEVVAPKVVATGRSGTEPTPSPRES